MFCRRFLVALRGLVNEGAHLSQILQEEGVLILFMLFSRTVHVFSVFPPNAFKD
jgi:hypothetical protein